MSIYFLKGLTEFNRQICSGDYAPCICSCENGGYTPTIHCGNLPFNAFAETLETGLKFEAQGNGSHRIKFIELKIPPTEVMISVDLLAYEIDLKCEAIGVQRLKIHPDAFRSSQNFTSKVAIQNCDVTGMNFVFLNGFHNLIHIHLNLVSNVHLVEWSSLPALPGLQYLSITYSTGLNAWTAFPNLSSTLAVMMTINLQGNRIDDGAIDRILMWILDSAKIKFWRLDISRNSLTDIPQKLALLNGLINLDLSYNPMNGIIIRSNSVYFSPVMELHLQSVGIISIQPRAIVGRLHFNVYFL